MLRRFLNPRRFAPLVAKRTQLSRRLYATTPKKFPVVEKRPFRKWNNEKYVSPYDLHDCPYDVIVLYNPSLHANNVAVEDILRTWPNANVVQTIQEGRRPVVGVTDHFSIPRGTWGNMETFNAAWKEFVLKNRHLHEKNLKIGFYPVWSAIAEDSSVARKVIEGGFHWIGASPKSMDGLGKIEYKTFCKKFDLPTAPFFTLSVQEDDKEVAIKRMCDEYFSKVKGSPLENKPFFVKSEYGGGGRGTKKAEPTEESVHSAISKVVAETGKIDGIYAELALDLTGASMYQLEMEVDAGNVVDGGRFVYFNNRNQKMIELGFSSEEIIKFLPPDVYEHCIYCTEIVARESEYDGRGTNEILIVKHANGHWEIFNSEFNKRIQVEHKALSYLKRYSTGHLFNTVADQIMRSCGYCPPDYKTDLKHSGCNAVGHIRLINPRIAANSDIEFPTGVVVEGICLPKGYTATLDVGPLFADTDAQFGCALVMGADWKKLTHSLSKFAHETVILGKNIRRDYWRFLQKFFDDSRVADLTLPCNKTFEVLQNETKQDSRLARVVRYLEGSVSQIFVNTYRNDAGVPNRPYPTGKQIDEFLELRRDLRHMPLVKDTPFLRYLDHLNEDQFFEETKASLELLGGGMVSVFPRDVQQEMGGSESQLIATAGRLIMEKVGSACGYVGYEMGGAQYQTGEMNKISSMLLLREGLPFNTPTYSLTRSHWMNALELLTPEEIKYILETTAKVIRERFQLPADSPVPYFPYNFHAGNVVDQDEVTGLMLDEKITPIPCFSWDPRFTMQDFEGWVDRQLKLWKSKGRTLHHIRIKNAGQQREYTAPNMFKYVQTIRTMYKKAYGEKSEPIIHLHNHNFNGLAPHVVFQLMQMCQEVGYRLLVVDAAPPYMTHNNNLVVSKALCLNNEQRDLLEYFNEGCHTIWNLTSRFHEFPSIQTDPDTIWAGGTGSSDQIAARKVGLKTKDVEPAKRLGAQVTGLGAIVTPYSQWSMVVGFNCYLKGLRTIEAVEEHVNKGGSLDIPKNIMIGLDEWKTLLKRPPLVDKIIANQKKADPTIFQQDLKTRKLDVEAIKKQIQEAAPNIEVTQEEIARVISYGNFALKCLESQSNGEDHNWLLYLPTLAYSKKVPPGTTFQVMGIPIHYVGCEDIPDSPNVVLTFMFEGQWVRVTRQDNAKAAKLSAIITSQIPTADPANENHVGAAMPGIVEDIIAKVGQKLNEGDQLYSINSMKMVTIFRATAAQVGKTVEHVYVNKAEELSFQSGERPPLIMSLK